MDDLIERLRASAKHSEVCGWFTHARLDASAADEIERLTTENESLKLTLIELSNNRNYRLAT